MAGDREKVRADLLRQFVVHTPSRLPAGIFSAQGVLRTSRHVTLKTNPLKRPDRDEFVACYRPGERHSRAPTWDAEKCPDGWWRAFDDEELAKRDRVNLDVFWLKGRSLEDSEDLPKPDILADEMADDLETALEQFQAVAAKLKGRT